MTVAPAPLAEITATAIRILCREIGAANTARFLNQFTSGFGDYTAERDQLLGESTVDELVAQIRQRRAPDRTSHKSVSKPKRRKES